MFNSPPCKIPALFLADRQTDLFHHRHQVFPHFALLGVGLVAQQVGRVRGRHQRNPAIGVPQFQREYLGAFLEACNTSLLPGAADALLDERYAALLANGVGVASPQFIKDYIAARRAYLLTILPAAAPSGSIRAGGTPALHRPHLP